MTVEYEEATRRMAELFKDDVVTIEKIVEPYGVLVRHDRDAGGVCRIEYRSNIRDRTMLEQNTFYLIRALTAVQSYTTISVYASTGKGTGMLVRVAAHDVSATFNDYKNRATISFIE